MVTQEGSLSNDTRRQTDARTHAVTRADRHIVWFCHFVLVTGPCCLKNDEGLVRSQNNIGEIAASNYFIMKAIM